MIVDVTTSFVLPVLGLAFVLAGVRATRGPHAADRVLALDLAGFVLVGGAAGLSIVTDQPVLMDVALVVALVAFVGTLALARLVERGR